MQRTLPTPSNGGRIRSVYFDDFLELVPPAPFGRLLLRALPALGMEPFGCMCRSTSNWEPLRSCVVLCSAVCPGWCSPGLPLGRGATGFLVIFIGSLLIGDRYWDLRSNATLHILRMMMVIPDPQMHLKWHTRVISISFLCFGQDIFADTEHKDYDNHLRGSLHELGLSLL